MDETPRLSVTLRSTECIRLLADLQQRTGADSEAVIYAALAELSRHELAVVMVRVAANERDKEAGRETGRKEG